MTSQIQVLLQDLRDFQDGIERSAYYWNFLSAGISILTVFVLCWFVFTAPYVLPLIGLFLIFGLVELKDGLQRLDRYEKRIEARDRHH